MRGHATQVAALSQVKKEQDPEERRILYGRRALARRWKAALLCNVRSLSNLSIVQNSSLSPFELPLTYSEIDATSAKL